MAVRPPAGAGGRERRHQGPELARSGDAGLRAASALHRRRRGRRGSRAGRRAARGRGGAPSGADADAGLGAVDGAGAPGRRGRPREGAPGGLSAAVRRGGLCVAARAGTHGRPDAARRRRRRSPDRCRGRGDGGGAARDPARRRRRPGGSRRPDREFAVLARLERQHDKEIARSRGPRRTRDRHARLPFEVEFAARSDPHSTSRLRGRHARLFSSAVSPGTLGSTTYGRQGLALVRCP